MSAKCLGKRLNVWLTLHMTDWRQPIVETFQLTDWRQHIVLTSHDPATPRRTVSVSDIQAFPDTRFLVPHFQHQFMPLGQYTFIGGSHPSSFPATNYICMVYIPCSQKRLRSGAGWLTRQYSVHKAGATTGILFHSNISIQDPESMLNPRIGSNQYSLDQKTSNGFCKPEIIEWPIRKVMKTDLKQDFSKELTSNAMGGDREDDGDRYLLQWRTHHSDYDTVSYSIY